MRRLLLAATAACLLLAGTNGARADFRLDDMAAPLANNYFHSYDFVLPILIGAVIVAPDMSDARKIDTVARWVNLHSTPAIFGRAKGLGSDAPWYRNASLMLRTGNLYCTEQSYLAAMILEPYFPVKAVRDVMNHSFIELALRDRWVILDPMCDMRIKNGRGEPASFEDVQAWLAGDATALRLPPQPLPRTLHYLDRFRRENYTPLHHAFGDHNPIRYPLIAYDRYVGMPVSQVLASLKRNGWDLDRKYCLPYMEYLRNNILALIRRAPDPAAEARRIQDWFHARIRENFYKKNYPMELDALYYARMLQMLGRFDQALAALGELEPGPDVAFYTAQIRYVQHDAEAFNALSVRLADNAFYRMLFFELNGRHLLPGDEESFRDTFFRLQSDDLNP